MFIRHISRPACFHTLLATLVATVFTTGLAVAQDEESYVVTVRNDTLYGEVKTNSILETNESLTLKVKDQKKKNYTPNTAKAFKHRGKIYHSVLLQNRYVFMESIVSGYMSLYQHESMSSSSTREINDYLKINLGPLTIVPKIGFRKKVVPLLAECPAVARKVEEKVYDFGDLSAIVNEYNQCVVNRPQSSQPQVAAAPSTPAPAPSGSVQATAEETATPVNTGINELLTYLKENPQTENGEDLTSCLNDINGKLKTGAAVPKYLLSALVNLTQPTEALKDKALKVATDLGYQAGK